MTGQAVKVSPLCVSSLSLNLSIGILILVCLFSTCPEVPLSIFQIVPFPIHSQTSSSVPEAHLSLRNLTFY